MPDGTQRGKSQKQSIFASLCSFMYFVETCLWAVCGGIKIAQIGCRWWCIGEPQ